MDFVVACGRMGVVIWCRRAPSPTTGAVGSTAYINKPSRHVESNRARPPYRRSLLRCGLHTPPLAASVLIDPVSPRRRRELRRFTDGIVIQTVCAFFSLAKIGPAHDVNFLWMHSKVSNRVLQFATCLVAIQELTWLTGSQCYQPIEAGTRFRDPGGMQG